MILLGIILTISWVLLGVHELMQPQISQISFACCWMYTVIMTLLSTMVIAAKSKKKSN